MRRQNLCLNFSILLGTTFFVAHTRIRHTHAATNIKARVTGFMYGLNDAIPAIHADEGAWAQTLSAEKRLGVRLRLGEFVYPRDGAALLTLEKGTHRELYNFTLKFANIDAHTGVPAKTSDEATRNIWPTLLNCSVLSLFNRVHYRMSTHWYFDIFKARTMFPGAADFPPACVDTRDKPITLEIGVLDRVQQWWAQEKSNFFAKKCVDLTRAAIESRRVERRAKNANNNNLIYLFNDNSDGRWHHVHVAVHTLDDCRQQQQQRQPHAAQSARSSPSQQPQPPSVGPHHPHPVVVDDDVAQQQPPKPPQQPHAAAAESPSSLSSPSEPPPLHVAVDEDDADEATPPLTPLVRKAAMTTARTRNKHANILSPPQLLLACPPHGYRASSASFVPPNDATRAKRRFLRGAPPTSVPVSPRER